jgi:catechol 2,3-dioxygenase
MTARAKPYRTTLGHVRLTVHDLQQAIDFYRRFIQLELVERRGDEYAFLSRGGDHHTVALFTGGRRAPRSAVRPSADHMAFEVQGRRAFARAFAALTGAGVPVTTLDNGISWSIYFQDPDGHNLEIFRDTRGEPGGQKLWRGVRKPLSREQVLSR